MKVDTLTPIVPAAPGETARCRVRVVNDSTRTTSYRVRVVGFDGSGIAVPLAGPVPPGHAADVDVHIDIPDTCAAGNHAVALEVTSTRHGERPLLADLMLSVDSTEHVVMTVQPSALHGRRRKRFDIYLDNRERDTADLRLSADGPNLKVRLQPDRVVLRPGETAHIRGKVKGPRLWVRDAIHHALTIEARGGAAPIYATAAFRQRPAFPRRLRTGLGVLTVLALWVGIAGGTVLYFRHLDRHKSPAAVEQPAGSTSGQPGDTVPGGAPGTGPAPEPAPPTVRPAPAGSQAMGARTVPTRVTPSPP